MPQSLELPDSARLKNYAEIAEKRLRIQTN